MSTTRLDTARLRADPKRRADDFNAAFADPGIDAIVTTIGGDDSARILPFVDVEQMVAHPKILMGFSDTTAQLWAAHQSGLVTFHGPTVMAGLAQATSFPALEAHIRAVLFDPTPVYEYRPFDAWTEEYANWETTDDPSAVGALRRHDGWRVLNGQEPVRGRLAGGCAEVLEILKGSSFWPVSSWWDDRILFLETSELVPSVDQVRLWLLSYGVQGIFDRIAGLLIGRPRGYSHEDKRRLDAAVHDLVVDDFGASSLPILTNVDIGHTDPQWIVPLGVAAEVDPARQRIRLLEPAVL